ncbi:ASCH domain-containing protein [Acinetobacter sp. Marseille-Q1618]|uniref:ASCH domain-containing protein n=1 Tax=Acinetobacter sp. Marseille-Q1618 TaxID=2697502 RepID=UPI0015713E44|nr:ASCH domain-containing protein [Acinetobacter sp. Marseille-Q1618]
MLKTYSALSIVAPSGTKIAQGLKTLEIRSWTPKQLPLRDLVIVENTQFLTAEYTEEMGSAVAIVDIASVHPWREDEVEAACASNWAEGYWAWVICNVRPISQPFEVLAQRKIYLVDLDHL